MKFDNPVDGLECTSDEQSNQNFSLTDLASSVYIKAVTTRSEDSVGINRLTNAITSELDISGSVLIDNSNHGDFDMTTNNTANPPGNYSTLRVQPYTRNAPGPNKIVLYESPFNFDENGLRVTPETCICLCIETDTIKFHSTTGFKWYHATNANYDFLQNDQNELLAGVSSKPIPTINGELALQLDLNDLSLNGNMHIHGGKLFFSPTNDAANNQNAFIDNQSIK